MKEPEVIMTIKVLHQNGAYWSEVEQLPRFTAADGTLQGLLDRVVRAWEEMGGWPDRPEGDE
jgi:hypothetical protein